MNAPLHPRAPVLKAHATRIRESLHLALNDIALDWHGAEQDVPTCVTHLMRALGTIVELEIELDPLVRTAAEGPVTP